MCLGIPGRLLSKFDLHGQPMGRVDFGGVVKAMKFVAGATKVQLPADAAVNAEVGIGPNDKGGFSLAVSLQVSLPGMPADAAQALVSKAHEVCPYSNATRNNIDVGLTIG